MNFLTTTVSAFFGTQRIKFVIPAYQRAYSWENLQISTFLEDLVEHKHSSQNNPYCFGNILLEKISEGRKYEIIDGQQRITTISLFMRALLNVMKERMRDGERFVFSDGEEISIEAEEDNYFRDHGVVKLEVTSYDQACYEAIIIDNRESYNCTTPSQKRMLTAKSFFIGKLETLSSKDLIAIFETIRNSIINRIELTGKKESALMFELQNNRGKELTNLEKLKSFLMYQLYAYSNSDETDGNIEYVSNEFKALYSIVNQMSVQLGDNDDDGSKSMVNEDNILVYHSYAYSVKNFGYRNLNDIVDEFKSRPNEEKAGWIREYAYNLHQSFTSIQEILSRKDVYLEKIKTLGIPFFVYPFLIKGAGNKDSLPKLFQIMEALSFRYKLINSRADIRSRLTDLIREYNGNNDELAEKMKTKMNDAYYWGDIKFVEILNGNMFQNNRINYFLSEYEQDLQKKGYVINGTLGVADQSIEHISPQTEPGDAIESGYEVDAEGYYSKEFREQYLHKLGNLMIISQSHNSSIGNRPFNEKLESYIENPLLRQQMEIVEYVEDRGNPKWDIKAIEKRHKKMMEFALSRWAF